MGKERVDKNGGYIGYRESDGRSSLRAMIETNPIMIASEAGYAYGVETAGKKGNPYVPKEYDFKTNPLGHLAYMNGVRKGRLDKLTGAVKRGKVKVKGNGDRYGVDESEHSVSVGGGNVRRAVPVTEIGQRTHPSIRPSGSVDRAASGGKCEQGSGGEGRERVGEDVPET